MAAADDDRPLTFEDALRLAASNPELLAEYDRLNKTNLSRRGTPLDLAIDDATGRSDAEIRDFAAFVFEYVWRPVLEGSSHGE